MTVPPTFPRKTPSKTRHLKRFERSGTARNAFLNQRAVHVLSGCLTGRSFKPPRCRQSEDPMFVFRRSVVFSSNVLSKLVLRHQVLDRASPDRGSLFQASKHQE